MLPKKECSRNVLAYLPGRDVRFIFPRYFPFKGQAAAAAAGIQGRHPSLPRESHSQLHTQSLTREQNATDGRTNSVKTRHCKSIQEGAGGAVVTGNRRR